MMLLFFLFACKFYPLTLLLFPLLLFGINIFGELILKKEKFLIFPFLASIFQISWILGFFWEY